MVTQMTAPMFGSRGHRRGIGLGIFLFVITLGFYGWYWAFKTHEEMRQHTGDGLGGVLGLVIWILISPVSAFVIPSEIGKMYKRAGQSPPVTVGRGCGCFRSGSWSSRRSSGS